MQPYVHLDIPHETITNKLKQFVIDRRYHLDGSEKGAFLTGVSSYETFKAVPELKTLFEMYELDNFAAMMIVKAPPTSEGITYPHTDVMPPEFKETCIAINWPILNCEKTYTTFYEAKPGALGTTTRLVNGLPYTYYKFDEVIEQHRIKINKPTALRYDAIHAVINDTNDFRFTASFRFFTNHWKLFNEQYK